MFRGVLLLLTGALLATRGARAEAPADHTPHDWLAFVAVTGGFAPAITAVRDATPTVLVLRSGQVLWRDDERAHDATRRDPDMWRTGQADPKALAAFEASVRSGLFLTASREQVRPGAFPPPRAIPDARITHVGVNFKGARRVARISGLEVVSKQPEVDALTRSTAAVRDAILALRPGRSRRYEPESIRVGFYPGGGTEPAPWPLPDHPKLTAGQFVYYRGTEARTIIATVARTTQVRVGDQTFRVDWAPAIDTPVDVPAAFPKR